MKSDMHLLFDDYMPIYSEVRENASQSSTPASINSMKIVSVLKARFKQHKWMLELVEVNIMILKYT